MGKKGLLDMTEKRKCVKCGAEIPQKRIEALPATKVCVKCSEMKPYSEQQLRLDVNDKKGTGNKT